MERRSIQHTNKSVFLISLSGIDGAGKSSIALAVHDYLIKRYDIECKTVWCKFGNSPINNPQIIRIVKRFLLLKVKPNKVNKEYKINKSTSLVRQIYGNMLLLNHLFEIFFNIRVPLLRGKIVICDRYIFDTMVDLQQEFGFTMEHAREAVSANWIPKPNYKFLLDLPAESAFQRKTDTESENFLIERRRLYLEIAQFHGIHVIDSNQTFQGVLNQVLELIELTHLPVDTCE
jgi:thymidylate kinase